jgi:transposase
MDLRQRVLADSDAGMKTADAAQKYSVSESWVRRLKQRRRQTGETAPRQQRRGPVPLSATHGEQIRRAVSDQPDATLEELKAKLGLAVALSTLWAAVAALGLRLKKKSPAPPSRTGRT